MEKKTMGSFIAALRRSNGMTQKELAEELGVTDKTVSRWETDEGMPDISLIPVIAEIFGITCDELLRGERNSMVSQYMADTEKDDTLSKKAEKQLRNIIRKGLMWLKTMSFISIGIAALGLVASSILNFGFLKAYAGFFTGLVFTVSALVTEAVSIVKAVSNIDDDVMTEEMIGKYRTDIIKYSLLTFTAIITMFGATVPLLAVYSSEMGITFVSAVEGGTLCAAIFLAVMLVVSYLFRAHFIRKGIYYIPEERKDTFLANDSLLKHIAVVLIVVIAVTFFIHLGLCSDDYKVMKKSLRFEDKESFIEYMETPTERSRKYVNRYETMYGNGVMEVPVPDDYEKITTYYDQDGNEISFDAAHETYMADINNNILFTYVDRNENVFSLSYPLGDGTVFPISVSTYDDLYDAKVLISILNAVFCLLYCVEVLTGVIVYNVKRKKY